MLRRRSGKEPEPKKDKTILILHGGKAMDMAAVLTLSTLITIGGTIIGFMLGWFANSYYLNYMETVDGREETEEVKITAHPEMMDENGNPIPFQIAKLISVEFDEKDAFTRDPFTDLDD